MVTAVAAAVAAIAAVAGLVFSWLERHATPRWSARAFDAADPNIRGLAGGSCSGSMTPSRAAFRPIVLSLTFATMFNSTNFKKNALKPHRNRQWVIPPDANAGFVAAMENVLEPTRSHEIPIVLSCAWMRPPSN